MFSFSLSPLTSLSSTDTRLNIIIIIVSANPTEEYYNDDYNAEDYNYDDEPSLNDVSDDAVLSHIPKIVSNSVKLDVDNGMTIRLPCTVDKLPGRPGLTVSHQGR